jgi:hypothetical protein
MKILLIGNFAPPYEEESLHNLSLFNRLTDEGHQCTVINISANPSVEEGFIDNISYAAFVLKVIRHGFGKDVIHFLTKGYTRPGLMKMVTAIFLTRLMFARPFITLHPELFSVFGQLRSKMGGQQLLNLSFALAKKVICGDRHTYEVASLHYKSKEKFALIPSFVLLPADIAESERMKLKRIQGKKKVIVFSNLRYPSLLFNLLDLLLSRYLPPDTGTAVSFSEKFSSKLEHVVKDTGKDHLDNLLFIDSADHRLLSLSYSSANMILRQLSCDGKALFDNIALCVRKPRVSGEEVVFPFSLSLVKEGEVSDTCSYLFNDLLMRDEVSEPDSGVEDLYQKMIGIYSGNQ